MGAAPTFDHIALTVPDLDTVVARLTGAFGLTAEVRTDQFALTEPGGLEIQLVRYD